MQQNEQLIRNFYDAFIRKDFVTMQNCYDNNSTFSDPVFSNLNAEEVKAMWEMFCKKGKDLQLTYSIKHVDSKYVEANWIPTYTFSATGKKVVNNITSKFIIENNKIISHHDHFNFYKWASQALGFPGLLLGWTPMIKNKVKKSAAKNLQQFIKNNN